MKAKVIGKKEEIELPNLFSGNVREDIALKYFYIVRENEKMDYGNSPKAGKEFSDKVKHAKRKFRGHYGRGISRIPRKVFWRRGTQFYWEGAGVSGARGGRRAHPPKPGKERRMNKKEIKKAIISALTSTAKKEWIKKRYSTLDKLEINLPLIIGEDALKLDTKEFYEFLNKNLKNLNWKKKKKVRKGKGKMRSRKYKKSAGLLLVLGSEEEKKVNGIDVKKVGELGIEDFWPLGRLVVYTENAIKDLEKIWSEEE